MAEPIVSQATAGRDASAIENFSLQHMIKPGAADSDVRTAETRAAIRPGPPAAVERRMSAALAHACRGDLHRIVAPTLVGRGEGHPFISPAPSAWTVDPIPGAKLVLVTEAAQSSTRPPRSWWARVFRYFVLGHSDVPLFFS